LCPHPNHRERTASREKICHAKYIRADYLEGNVWEKVREVLENPAIVFAGVKEQLDASQGCQAESLDKEILRLKRKMKRLRFYRGPLR